MPRVSILMPTYNSAAYIKKSIDSVCSQDFKDWELIIIDDGSTDNTYDIVASFQAILQNRLTYIRTHNQGASLARNVGLKLCRGAFIAFLDSDDIWDSQKLSKQLEIFDQNPSIDLVFSNALIIDSNDLSTNKNYVKPSELEIPAKQIYTQILAKRNYIPFSSIVVKKPVADEVGEFDDAFKSSQDSDWLLRLASKHMILGINENLVFYRVHGASISSDIGLRKHDTVRILLKNIELNPPIGQSTKKEIYKRVAEHYYGWGYHEFSTNHLPSAREKFSQSIRHSPWVCPQKYFYMLLTFLPLRFLSNLKKFKRKIGVN